MKRWALAVAAVLLIGPPALAATRVLVLPFDVPPDASKKIASLGIGTMDSMIAAFSRLPAFIVVDRATVNQVLKEQAAQASGFVDPASAGRIGRIIGASAIITGRIQVVGDKVRITANFIDGQTTQIRKVEQVTGTLSDAFDLQDQIATRFLSHEGVKPSEEQSRQTAQVFKATTSLTAYEAYQQGRNEYLKFTTAGCRAALQWYTAAIEADPKYALGHAAIAECHALLGSQLKASRQPYAASYDQAVAAAGRALDIDGRLPEANRAMSVALLQKQDSLSRFYAERAHDGAPNDAETLVALWASKGSDPDGPEILQAISHNPRLTLAHTQRGVVLLQAGRLDEAITEFQYVLNLEPASAIVHNALGDAFAGKGMIEAAIEAYRTAIRWQSDIPDIHENLAAMLLARRRSDEAIAEYLVSISLNGKVARPHYHVACAYALKGDADKALQHLGQAIALNPQYRAQAQADSDFAGLHTDDRFVALCGAAKLP